MSAKSLVFGLPAEVVDRALLLGAHADCLVQRDANVEGKCCSTCRTIMMKAVDFVYAHLATPNERARMLILDTQREQAEG